MELIVAVYEDWGIGREGTQPIALSADRKFFREMTRGAAVIVGRRTVEDFPGQRPLPGRTNLVLSRTAEDLPGFTLCRSIQEVLDRTRDLPKVMVIGGGSIYRALLPWCTRAYVTKVHAAPESDTWFPDLDRDPAWTLTEVLQSGEESGIGYEMCLYERTGK